MVPPSELSRARADLDLMAAGISETFSFRDNVDERPAPGAVGVVAGICVHRDMPAAKTVRVRVSIQVGMGDGAGCPAGDAVRADADVPCRVAAGLDGDRGRRITYERARRGDNTRRTAGHDQQADDETPHAYGSEVHRLELSHIQSRA